MRKKGGGDKRRKAIYVYLFGLRLELRGLVRIADGAIISNVLFWLVAFGWLLPENPRTFLSQALTSIFHSILHHVYNRWTIVHRPFVNQNSPFTSSKHRAINDYSHSLFTDTTYYC